MSGGTSGSGALKLQYERGAGAGDGQFPRAAVVDRMTTAPRSDGPQQLSAGEAVGVAAVDVRRQRNLDAVGPDWWSCPE